MYFVENKFCDTLNVTPSAERKPDFAYFGANFGRIGHSGISFATGLSLGCFHSGMLLIGVKPASSARPADLMTSGWWAAMPRELFFSSSYTRVK